VGEVKVKVKVGGWRVGEGDEEVLVVAVMVLVGKEKERVGEVTGMVGEGMEMVVVGEGMEMVGEGREMVVVGEGMEMVGEGREMVVGAKEGEVKVVVVMAEEEMVVEEMEVVKEVREEKGWAVAEPLVQVAWVGAYSMTQT
jgi:hypothetical protein